MYKDSTGKYTTSFKNITQNTYNGILCNNYHHDEFPDDEFIDKFIATLAKSGNSYIFNSISRNNWHSINQFNRN